MYLLKLKRDDDWENTNLVFTQKRNIENKEIDLK
jgi:hypothetical protein